MNAVPWHFKLGNFKCIAIRDGGHMGSADFLFCNAPQQEVAQALQKYGVEADQLISSWTCLLVDTGEKTLLIDTGVGSGISVGGQLVSQLAQEGYPQENIDLVFLTHGHGDRSCSKLARYLCSQASATNLQSLEVLKTLDFLLGMEDSRPMAVEIHHFHFVKLFGLEFLIEFVDQSCRRQGTFCTQRQVSNFCQRKLPSGISED